MSNHDSTRGMIITPLDGWFTDRDGEVRVGRKRFSAMILQRLGARAAVTLKPFDRTKPSSWCFGYRRAREGMICWNPALGRRPGPVDLDEGCFLLGFRKGKADAKQGIHYEIDCSTSNASDYAEVGIRIVRAGSTPAVR